LALVFAGGVAFAEQPPGPAPGHQHMHGGMCPMMGMMGGQSDPRTIQMRGEMMKAMGDNGFTTAPGIARGVSFEAVR
jgi:hypothetical protein